KHCQGEAMPPRTRNLRACFLDPLQVRHTVNSKTKFPGHHCDDGRSGKYRRTFPNPHYAEARKNVLLPGSVLPMSPCPKARGFYSASRRKTETFQRVTIARAALSSARSARCDGSWRDLPDC